MRDYAKLAPTFWTGITGKALRRRGPEGVIVALYLISSPRRSVAPSVCCRRYVRAHMTKVSKGWMA